jgi:SAM-dependent methyltransferase
MDDDGSVTQPKRYAHASDLDSWRSDDRIAERGFAHAWVSRVGEGNGEDFFLATLDQLVAPDDVVLDLGCGHGELTLALAARARTAIGVDRDSGYLTLARELARERGVTNVRFHEFAFAKGGARLPLADASVTLVVNRRGPTADKWLGEVRRVARPGTPVLVMHPAGGPPRPTWSDELPASLDACFGSVPFDQVRSWVETPLAAAGVTDYQVWWFDVPEWFSSAEDLHRRLVRDGLNPPFTEARTALHRIIADHSDAHGLPLRHQRLVAQFRFPDAGS